MKKYLSLIVAALLACALACACCACGEKNETDPPLSYIGEDYRIVYAEGDAAAKSAAESAAKSVLGYGGGELSVVSDSVPAEGKEIIVGPAGGREYSAYTSKMAKKNGWFVGVLGGDVYIQTNTGSYGGALGAFEQYFVRQAFDEETAVYSSGNYPSVSVRLNGIPLSFYEIVYAASNTRAQMKAYELSTWISENIGYTLDVVGSASSEGEYRLFIGMLNAEGDEGENLSSDEYAAEFGENYVGICSDREILSESVDSFVTRYFDTGEQVVSVSENGSKTLKCWEYLNTHLQTQSASDAEQIIPGVQYEQVTMTNAQGNIVTAYVLVAEAGAGWELKAATHPDYRKGSPVVSTVLNTAQLLQKTGQDVLFACNGGFFRMNDHNYPEGVLIKDGQSYTHVNNGLGESGSCFFGVTKAGEYVAGDYSVLQNVYSDLWQAVGGRGWLLKDGQLNDICFGDGDALGESRHPRTAVGWRENGDLIFAVVDGRQDGYSGGVNLCDLALLMQSYGAVGAQNLDGGGSSTFVTKNADGTLSVKNKPSNANNALRAVGDCLVLVRKV